MQETFEQFLSTKEFYVRVKILSAAGAELEQGDAVPDVANYWAYTATAANAAVLGTRIQITWRETINQAMRLYSGI